VSQIKRGERQKTGVTLLSVFGGVGTDQVVLKRLGLKIDKVLHVEKDMVADHVAARHNHDRGYNQELPDDGDIQHFYYETFETVEKDIESICSEHGRKF